MKILKILLYIILILVGVMLILSLIMPKSGIVSRTVVIKAPKATVWSMMKDLKMHQKWSPWAEKDPNMVNTFEGNDGEIGQKNSWKGNKDVGEGSQEITKMEAEALLVMHLHFKEPFDNETNTSFALRDTTDMAVAVTWSMDWSMPWPMNAMCAFMSMDKMIGPDFEKGLNKLKGLAEAAPAPVEATSYEIKEIEMPTRTYWGKREVVTFDKIGDFFAKNLPGLMKNLGMAGAELESAPSGLFFKYDEKAGNTDMAAAFAAKGSKSKPHDCNSWEVKGGKALCVDYYGDYMGTKPAHDALSKHMTDNKMELSGPVIEEYVTDPGKEKDTAKWLTKIYYPVK